MERSLVLVKPDAMKKNAGGSILARFEENGFKVVGLRMLRIDEALARKHYEMHVEKKFFGELLEFITSGPVIAAVLEGEGAIDKARTLMGSTNPAEAANDTIRKDFGTDIQMNAVHGSDSPESATREISLFFGGYELF